MTKPAELDVVVCCGTPTKCSTCKVQGKMVSDGEVNCEACHGGDPVCAVTNKYATSCEAGDNGRVWDQEDLPSQLDLTGKRVLRL